MYFLSNKKVGFETPTFFIKLNQINRFYFVSVPY